MSLFKRMMSKIFGSGDGAPTANTTHSAPTARVSDPTSIQPAPTKGSELRVSPATPVDVEAVLNGLAAKNSDKLEWRKSIVDLMKLLDMDSSLSSRKELATELKYTGDQGDSATMNIWLHKQVLKKLSENGGKVPADLLD